MNANAYARIVGNNFLDNLFDDELVRRCATLVTNENGVVTIVIDFNKMTKADLIGFKREFNE